MAFTPQKWRVGGVPEHFNYPWQLARENKLTARQEFDFTWLDYPGGTGAMALDLAEGKLDLALMLTEGAVAAIAKGLPAKIIGVYVESPLTWGIHTHATSPYNSLDEVQQKTFAISRPNSGSHLMAYVLAQTQQWLPESLHFEVVGNFEGARQALASGKTQLFMWEKYTTAPTVRAGEWKRIGECLTPWPAFVIVAHEAVVGAPSLPLLLRLIREQALPFYPQAEDRLAYIRQQYPLHPEDVAEWYAQTRWAIQSPANAQMLNTTQDTLLALGILSEKKPIEALSQALDF
ncbi:MAG: substrate-binding domain-containing protein [Microscillaceae bacterium]